MATRSAETVQKQNPFAIDLFNFLWRHLDHAHGQIVNPANSYFNDDIGYSVLYIQFITRRSLRDIFTGMSIITEDHAINLTRKLCRARRSNEKNSGVFQVFLECCAIVAEVYLYCCCTFFEIESSMFFSSWDLVFSRRRIEKLIDGGGWKGLTAYARKKYHGKIGFINYELENMNYPCENFITSQSYDHETYKMVVDLENYSIALSKKLELQLDMREKHLNLKYKDGRSKKREKGDVSAKQKMGTFAMRSTRRAEKERMEASSNVSPYVTSDEEDCIEDSSLFVSKLCTLMYDAHISSSPSESKKKKQKRKRKQSCKATVTEEGPEISSIESTDEKGSTSETLTSSSRPSIVPAQSPETSKTKSETKVTSHEQSTTGRKGKKKNKEISSIESTDEKGSTSETLTSSSRPLIVPAQSPETSKTKSETKVSPHEQSKTGRKGKKKNKE